MKNGFELSYPSGSFLARNPSPDDLVLRISLPFTGDTSLEEKFLRVSVKEGDFFRPCGLWLQEYESFSKVKINGIEFTKVTAEERANSSVGKILNIKPSGGHPPPCLWLITDH